MLKEILPQKQYLHHVKYQDTETLIDIHLLHFDIVKDECRDTVDEWENQYFPGSRSFGFFNENEKVIKKISSIPISSFTFLFISQSSSS